MSQEIIALGLLSSSFVSTALIIAGLVYLKKGGTSENTSGTSTGSSAGTSASGSSSGATGEWKSANATYYDSYPACCKTAPNYSPSADKSECEDYSGCKYMGQFTGLDKKLSYSEVSARNIVSFYSAPNQKTDKKMAWWTKNIKGKKMEIRNPKTGKTLVVEPLDTCGDWDCNNCCFKNATKGGLDTLIDIESHTAKRFWGGSPQNGKIDWRFV